MIRDCCVVSPADHLSRCVSATAGICRILKNLTNIILYWLKFCMPLVSYYLMCNSSLVQTFYITLCTSGYFSHVICSFFCIFCTSHVLFSLFEFGFHTTAKHFNKWRNWSIICSSCQSAWNWCRKCLINYSIISVVLKVTV